MPEDTRYFYAGRCSAGHVVLLCTDRADRDTADTVGEAVVSGLTVTRHPMSEVDQHRFDIEGGRKNCPACASLRDIPERDDDDEDKVRSTRPEMEPDTVMDILVRTHPCLRRVLESVLTGDGVFDLSDLRREAHESGLARRWW